MRPAWPYPRLFPPRVRQGHKEAVCNIVTLAVVQQGGQHQLHGTDDQCGALVQASAIANGTITTADLAVPRRAASISGDLDFAFTSSAQTVRSVSLTRAGAVTVMVQASGTLANGKHRDARLRALPGRLRFWTPR